MEEQEIKLPEVVLGFMYMKKLRLDHTGESLLMTATKGDLTLKEIEKAAHAVFPGGKGQLSKSQQKEVFQAEQDETGSTTQENEEEELQSALEFLADEVQSKSEYDEEEVLKAFESYQDIRRKIADQKKGRGFFPRPTLDRQKTEAWK